jgi:hypothetical protein
VSRLPRSAARDSGLASGMDGHVDGTERGAHMIHLAGTVSDAAGCGQQRLRRRPVEAGGCPPWRRPRARGDPADRAPVGRSLPRERPRSVLAVARRLTRGASKFSGGFGGSGAGMNAL